MGRISEKTKSELMHRFVENAKPITDKQIEWCRKDTARYIWHYDKDYYNGHCERCGNDVSFTFKTRHNQSVRCPKCKQKMTTRHKWRGWTENVDFRVIVKVLNNYEVLLRYILIEQIQEKRTVEEVAKEVIDFKKKTIRHFGYDRRTGKWGYGNNGSWFTRTNMYNWRRYCCYDAREYRPGLKKELKKLDVFKYIEDPTRYFSHNWYVTSVIRELGIYANVYEKFEKAGHIDFGIYEFKDYLGYYGKGHEYIDTEQTELHKMLKLTKGNYRRWCNNQTKAVLQYLQECPNISDEALAYVSDNAILLYDYKRLMDTNVGHEMKLLKYVTKNNIDSYEYYHYVYMLRELNYKLDKSYLFPKDFRKEDARITGEYNKMVEQREIDKQNEQSELIKQISEGLRNMEDLKEFMDGSNGLLVYVPDSVKDLYEESKALHNCISTYVDRVAGQKTLLFFVRKLDTPNAPFVAFEYCNGEVVQCRYDHNEAVKNDTEEGAKILNFVDAFAKRLRANKVLYNAA